MLLAALVCDTLSEALMFSLFEVSQANSIEIQPVGRGDSRCVSTSEKRLPKVLYTAISPTPLTTEHQVDGSIDTYTNEDSTRKPPNVTLPQIRGLSETIERILEKLDVRVWFSPNQTLRQLLVKPKDPIPLHQRNGVVYRIPCGDCEKSM